MHTAAHAAPSCFATLDIVSVRDSPEYKAIVAFYGDRRAERTQVPLIAHIDEGLAILEVLHASDAAKRAFCLHPIVQGDDDLVAAVPRFRELTDDIYVMALAIEYRWVANASLSDRAIERAEDIPLSPLRDVVVMLAADKVQNRKDFERYHRGTHPRSDALERYFRLWLARVGITDSEYERLVQAANTIVVT